MSTKEYLQEYYNVLWIQRCIELKGIQFNKYRCLIWHPLRVIEFRLRCYRSFGASQISSREHCSIHDTVHQLFKQKQSINDQKLWGVQTIKDASKHIQYDLQSEHSICNSHERVNTMDVEASRNMLLFCESYQYPENIS